MSEDNESDDENQCDDIHNAKGDVKECVGVCSCGTCSRCGNGAQLVIVPNGIEVFESRPIRASSRHEREEFPVVADEPGQQTIVTFDWICWWEKRRFNFGCQHFKTRRPNCLEQRRFRLLKNFAFRSTPSWRRPNGIPSVCCCRGKFSRCHSSLISQNRNHVTKSSKVTDQWMNHHFRKRCWRWTSEMYLLNSPIWQPDWRIQASYSRLKWRLQRLQ